MILCPRTGRKPWKCLCPECVAQRTAVGGDVSPTPNRDAGWAPARAVILSDRPVRIAGGAITRGLYFFSRWRRAPGGDILWGPDGQPQREGGPGDGGLQCCVPEQSRSLLRGAMHVASVKPPTVVQLFRTANSEYFALRTYDGEYTFSRDTLDRALREMHEARCEPLNNTQGALDMVVSETGVHTPRHWVERGVDGGAAGDPGDGRIIGGRLRIWRTDPATGEIILNSEGKPLLAGDPGDGMLSGPIDEFEREYPVVVHHVDYVWAARNLANTPVKARAELRTTPDHGRYALREGMTVHAFPADKLDRRVGDLVQSRKKLSALGFSPKAGPQEAFMIGEHQDKRAFDLGEWARNGEWVTDAPPAELVFRHETDQHLVGRARRLMGARRHLGGYPSFVEDTPLSLFYCSADDRYLIRVPLEQLQEPHDVVVGHDELVDYRVPPDAIPIDRLSTRIAVHRALEESTKRKIPFPELRAWLQSTVDRVFCAWGAGVATLDGRAAELGLQKTDRSPTMESPE